MKKRFTGVTALLLSLALLLPLLPAAAGAEEDLSGATVTLSRDVYEYNGSAHEPEVTVTLNGLRLQRDVDYTVDYRSNVKAGEASVIVTGIGGYRGSDGCSFRIRPRSMGQRDLSFDELPLKSYDGGGAVTFGASVDTVSDDQVTASCQAVFSDPFAGRSKEVRITSVTLSGPDSENYQLDLSYPIVLYNGQITPAEPGVRSEAEMASGGHTLDLRSLLTNTAAGQTVRFALSGQTQGSTLSESGVLTSGDGSETLRVSVTIDPFDVNGDGTPEYTLAQRSVTVEVVKEQGQAPEIRDQGDGTGDQETGTTDPAAPDPAVQEPAAGVEKQAALSFSGSDSVTYGETLNLGVAGGSGSGAVTYTVRPVTGDAAVDSSGVLTPKKAGTVWVTAQKRGDDRYGDGDPVSREITIRRAKLTVVVKNKTAVVGDPAPGLSASDYMVSGLKAGDSLRQAPSLRYDPTPDMSKPGSVSILASGAAVPDTDNYDPDIAYTAGTLTVTEVPAYSVTLVQPQNGTLTADCTGGKEGESVTVTVLPASGYACQSLLVQAANGQSVPVSDLGNGVYSFRMPAAAVTVSANLAAQEVRMPFNDVKESDWFYGSVEWAWRSGLMNGTAEGQFSPKASTSRGMIVTLLYRLAGSPEAPRSSPFGDVSQSAWYAGPVAWAAWNGIVTGYSASSFAPNDPITREQFATILYRYAQFRGLDVSPGGSLSGFSDGGRVSAYARDAMSWANAQGLITGTGNRILDPKGQATRAQAAAILQRFVERYP